MMGVKLVLVFSVALLQSVQGRAFSRGDGEEEEGVGVARKSPHWMMPMYYGLIEDEEDINDELVAAPQAEMLRSRDGSGWRRRQQQQGRGPRRRKAAVRGKSRKLPAGFRPSANPWMIWQHVDGLERRMAAAEAAAQRRRESRRRRYR